MTAHDPPDRIVGPSEHGRTDPSTFGTDTGGTGVTVTAGGTANTLARYAAPEFNLLPQWFRHSITVTSYGGTAGGMLYLSYTSVDQSHYPDGNPDNYPANWMPFEADAVGTQQVGEDYTTGKSNMTLHNQADGDVTVDWTVEAAYLFDEMSIDVRSYR